LRVIKAVLFEPVGCLAEFPAGPFNEIAAQVFSFTADPGETGSEAYWQLIELMSESGLRDTDRPVLERLELQAVDEAHVYEDVVPALEALRAMDIALLVASSLSARAVRHFLDRSGVADFFSGVWTRDNTGGVKAAPLLKALDSLGYQRDEVMALVDTEEGVELVKDVGANAIVMINDYDEGRRLVTHAPAGAIVSLHELPDAIRLVADGANVRRPTGAT
jgi:beta-phosphoglucomutase-like phosphatase (HAD superfamily)